MSVSMSCSTPPGDEYASADDAAYDAKTDDQGEDSDHPGCLRNIFHLVNLSFL